MMEAIDTRYLPRTVSRAPRALLTWARYLALHEAVRVPLIGGHRLASFVARFMARRQPPARDRVLERAVQARYWALLAADFDNAQRGVYPAELLFDVPFAEYAGNVPRFLLDAPRILERIEANDHRDLPADVDLSAYPAYYRRTFHWQTDGYFSRHSAELYDLGVELLFIGTADVMRRQLLAEVVRRRPRSNVRLLDVGMGTGRFLRQAASALPGSELCGVDLSPWYVSHAREQLAGNTVGLAGERARAVYLQGARASGVGAPARGAPGAAVAARLEVANAEALPFADGSFDVVTSIFMLHELPRRVRRAALEEMHRVLAPGGLLVLEDAAQPSESRELISALDRFSRDMHEPFFADYLDDDLATLVGECGFGSVATTPHFVSKVVSATKGLAREPGVLIN
jgi:ubiquinone/menaquinone biosynthesis C-methylase UbiE